MAAARTTVRLDARLLAEARRVALETGRSLNELFVDALRKALTERRAPRRRKVKLPTMGGRGVRAGVDLNSNAGLRDWMDADG